MTHRQTKLPLALRVVAAGCVVLWLACVSACHLEAFFCCDSHGHAAAGHNHDQLSHGTAASDTEAHQAHDSDAHHAGAVGPDQAPEAEGHSHGSHKHDDGKKDSCCSMLKAVVQTAQSSVVAKQILQPVTLHCALLDERLSALDTPDTGSVRPPARGEVVLTPEVCTDLANRSHAPPASA